MSASRRRPVGDAAARPARPPSAARERRRSQQANHPDKVPPRTAKHGAPAARTERPNGLRYSWLRGIRRRVITLGVAAVVLYGVAPAVLEVLGAYRRLTDVDPLWWIAVVAMSAAGTWCMCALQRLALNRARWFPVVTSQLAGAAFSKVVPGGSAAAAALQARMLTESGLPAAAVGTGPTAGALLLLGALAGLPLLVLPAVLLGEQIPDGLRQTAAVGLTVFAVLFAVGALLLVSDQIMRAVGRGLRAADLRLRRGEARSEGLPQRLFDERDLLRRSLGGAWVRAVALAARALDLRLPVPVRSAPGRRGAAAAVRRAPGLLRRAVARAAPAHPGWARRRRGRAHGDLGARGSRRGAGGAGHACLPSGLVLASAAGRSDRLGVAPPTLRRRTAPVPAAGVALTRHRARPLNRPEAASNWRSRHTTDTPWMRVIVVGVGAVGATALESLYEHHQCTAVDLDAARLKRMSDLFDVRVVHGNGAGRSALREAGVDRADLVLACTARDEANLVTAMLVRRFSSARTVIRTADMAYLETWRAGDLDVDFIVSSEFETASAVSRVVGSPGRPPGRFLPRR